MGLLDVLMPPLRLHGTYITRKGLYSHKLAAKHQLKRIGVVPLNVVNQISRSVKNKEKARQLLRQYEIKHPSSSLYGHYSSHGFVYEKSKAPIIDIPDLTGFEVSTSQLKPYVSFHTPKVEKSKLPANQPPKSTSE